MAGLDFLTKPDGAVFFMLLVVPGFVALRTMESRVAGERIKAGEALIDIVVFSALNDGIWAIVLHAFGITNPSKLQLYQITALLFVIVIVSPVLLALLYEKIRKRFSTPTGLIHPVPKPWDWLFKDHFKDPQQIIFTMRDGRRFGGLWQEPCFASSYPADEQIFIGEVYYVDQGTGQLIQKIPNHSGLLIDKATVDFIEFYDADRPLADQGTLGSGETLETKQRTRIGS